MKRLPIISIIILILFGATVAFLSNHNQVNDPSEGGKYLYIKEWGVRFKLPSDLQGKVVYATENNIDVTLPNPDQATTKGDNAYLTTEEFSSLPDSDCKLNLPSGDHGARMLISRTTESDAPYDKTDVKLAGYNYIATHGNGGYCSEKSDQSKELDFIKEIVASYKSMEVVN